jgi:hypothetical protein
LSADGGIRTANGYDEASGLFCCNMPVVTVPDQPTKDDALQALEYLRRAFRTFPFADGEHEFDAALGVDVIVGDPGMDESTFLCGLLTAACRPSLPLAPALVCNAPDTSGSRVGKGKLMRAAAIIGSGAAPEAFTKGRSEDELDKRISSSLMEGLPTVFRSALTEDPCKIRRLGTNDNVRINSRSFFVITGNGLQLAEDLVGRVILLNLDARMENPGSRPFPPGFVDEIFARRSELLGACLTIWRWGRQNKMAGGQPMGSFEVRAQWCRDPLLTLGCKDPVARGDEIRAKDPVRRAIVETYEMWWLKHQNGWVRAAELAPEVIETIDQNATRRIDGSLAYNRQRVTRWLASHTGTRIGGYVLEEMPTPNRSRPVLRHRLIKEGEL